MLRDHETTLRIFYTLAIATLGDLQNKTFPIGVLGYRNENNRAMVSAN
jgi:hypothetical protein